MEKADTRTMICVLTTRVLRLKAWSRHLAPSGLPPLRSWKGFISSRATVPRARGNAGRPTAAIPQAGSAFYWFFAENRAGGEAQGFQAAATSTLETGRTARQAAQSGSRGLPRRPAGRRGNRSHFSQHEVSGRDRGQYPGFASDTQMISSSFRAKMQRFAYAGWDQFTAPSSRRFPELEVGLMSCVRLIS